jgi:putative transposase
VLRIISRAGYETDLTDDQWEFIEPRFKELVGNYGNQAEWPKRELVNGVLYLQKTGCQWRMLPHDFPPYSTVHTFFRRARLCGLWEVIMDDLVRLARIVAGRESDPTYGIVDSQSTKTTGAADERGIDGGKKRKDANVIYA